MAAAAAVSRRALPPPAGRVAVRLQDEPEVLLPEGGTMVSPARVRAVPLVEWTWADPAAPAPVTVWVVDATRPERRYLLTLAHNLEGGTALDDPALRGEVPVPYEPLALGPDDAPRTLLVEVLAQPQGAYHLAEPPARARFHPHRWRHQYGLEPLGTYTLIVDPSLPPVAQPERPWRATDSHRPPPRPVTADGSARAAAATATATATGASGPSAQRLDSVFWQLVERAQGRTDALADALWEVLRTRGLPTVLALYAYRNEVVRALNDALLPVAMALPPTSTVATDLDAYIESLLADGRRAVERALADPEAALLAADGGDYTAYARWTERAWEPFLTSSSSWSS